MFNSELSVVQLWYLRKPSKVNIHQIFTLIFQDLTMRRVLHHAKLNIYPTERSKKPQMYFKFVKGTNFDGYEPKNYETKVLAPFEELDQLQAKTLTNGILRKYSLPTGFINEEIMKPLKKEGYMSSPPLLGAFGMKSLTKQAKKIIENLNQYLAEKEQQLSECVDTDREKFIPILQELQSLVFFIKQDNPELYQHILSNVKWVNQTKPMGVENDLSIFVEAMNIDLVYLEEH